MKIINTIIIGLDLLHNIDQINNLIYNGCIYTKLGIYLIKIIIGLYCPTLFNIVIKK